MNDKPVSRFMAKTMAELVTPGQLVAIRAVANRRHLDQEDLCLRVRGCKPEELTIKAASGFIDFMKTNSAQVVMGEIRRQQKLTEAKKIAADVAA